MSYSIFASLRETFPSSEFTLAASSGGSTTVATNLYYWVNGYSRGGMNLLTSLGRVAVGIGQKLVFTVTDIADGDDVFGFILSASATNDSTTAKILAIADARDVNQETRFTAPLVVNLTHDAHFGLGVTGALPTTNKLNGMIRYASGNYQQYVAQNDTWQVVNGWEAYISTTLSPLSTGVYKGGCDVPILHNESIIDLPDYTGGTSTTFRLSLLNGLTENQGNLIPSGSKISLVPLMDNDVAIAGDYLNNLIQIQPVHVVRRLDGTVTALSPITLTWEWGKPSYTLTSDLLAGYAIAFDVTLVNAVLPQGATLVFYLAEYGRISEKVQSSGSGSLVYSNGDRLRLYPQQLGALRGTGDGLIEVTGETYAYPINALARENFTFGLLPSTADQVAAISGISNGDITFRANAGAVLATEAIRAIVSTQAVTVTPSAWVSVGSVTANQLITVTVAYPCDANGIGTIRADYPDVIAGSAIGEFNPDKLRVFLRKNGTDITETTAIAVSPGTSQIFTIDNIGSSATLPTATASDIGFWDYGAISTITSGNSSNLTSGTYEVCIAYQYEGDTIVSISHATADGCIPELEFDLATAIAKSGYFSEVYQSGTLKPQVTGLNFANNWFTVTQNGSKLDIDLTGVSRLWPVATAPTSSFDYADGVRSGDSARLTVSPFTIYDCLDATTGAAVWRTRGSGSGGGSGGYTTLTQSFTIPSIAASQTVTVADASFIIDGLYVALPGGHFLLVNGTPSGLTINLKNEGFATATTVISNGAVLTVAGKPGTDGGDGNAATIAVGTVTTGSEGSSAIVTNSGTSSAAVFDITIPRGDTGANGTDGGIISTTSVTTTFTIPSLSSTQTQDFDDASWVSIGAVVFFSDGTNYADLEVTNKSTNTLTLKNTWGRTNGTTIAIAGKLSPSGKPGINGANGVNADMTRTSTDSVAIGTGSKTFTYSSSSNLGWVVGSRLRSAYDASNYVEGLATAVSATSTTINVDNAVGSGTYTSWNIAIAGDKGLVTTPIILDQITTPSAPDTGKTALYSKNDGEVYIRPAGGVEKAIGTGNSNVGGLDVMTEARTYFVDFTNGSDSSTGLSNLTAFKTLEKAVSLLPSIWKSGFDLTIQLLSDFTFAASAPLIIPSSPGGGSVIFKGNTSTPSNIKIKGSGVFDYQAIIKFSGEGGYTFDGLNFNGGGTGNQYDFDVKCPVTIKFANCLFDKTSSVANTNYYTRIFAEKGAKIQLASNTFSGNCYCFIYAFGSGSEFTFESSKITTVQGNPTVTFFGRCEVLSSFSVPGNHTFNGSITGQKYYAEKNAVAYGARLFPGSGYTELTGGQGT